MFIETRKRYFCLFNIKKKIKQVRLCLFFFSFQLKLHEYYSISNNKTKTTN